METVLEITKYTLPAFIVFLTSYLLLRSMLKNDYKKLHLKLRMDNTRDTIFLRMQAYERITLLLERIRFSNLVPRLAQQKQSVGQLKNALLNTIRSEFDHNLSQQIYVSIEAWSAACFARDEILKQINMTAMGLPLDANGFELSKRLLQLQADPDVPEPVSKALKILKTDAKLIYM